MASKQEEHPQKTNVFDSSTFIQFFPDGTKIRFIYTRDQNWNVILLNKRKECYGQKIHSIRNSGVHNYDVNFINDCYKLFFT